MILHATNKDVIIKESERLISGSVKIYNCEFTFDESWDGFAKTVVFSTNGSRLINMALVDNTCEIPVEVLRPNARIRIGVYGTDGVRSRPTTYSEWIPVEQGADVTGDYAVPPTPSVFDQWVAGIDQKHNEWNEQEQAREDAEAARVEAENARVEAEQKREDLETGYVAQAKAYAESASQSKESAAESKASAETAKVSAEQSALTAQTAANNALNYSNDAAYSAAQAKDAAANVADASQHAAEAKASAETATRAATEASASETAAKAAQAAAEKARDEAGEIAGGDFASKTEAKGYADTAEDNANKYTDQKIAAIPTPDVSGQIGTHNSSSTAHSDIRTLISNHSGSTSNPHGVTAAQVGAPTVAEMNAAIAAIPTPDVSGQINEHNASTSAHSDIRQLIQQSAGYTKAQTLADVTKTMFGLGADAVPDNLFSFLGKYNQHWWSILHGQASVEYKEKRTLSAQTIACGDMNGNGTVTYADSITIDQSSGAISLVSPKNATFAAKNTATQNETVLLSLRGKYLTDIRLDGASSVSTGVIVYVPVNAEYRATDANVGYSGFKASTCYVVSSEVVNIPAGETTYVHSTDRNAYPDSGTVDGLTYQYLGIPFQNAVTAPKIATGSYTGTGKYGSSNKNSLTFDFPVKALFVTNGGNGERYNIVGDNADYMLGSIVELWGGSFTQYAGIGSVSSSYGRKTNNGKTLEWYSTADAFSQFNASGKTYRYFAIG